MHGATRKVKCLARARVAFVQVRYGSTRHKVMSADDAVHLIHDGDTITVGGFVAQNCPEEILSALSRRYRATMQPSNLTVIFGGGPGDSKSRGLNHLAIEGLVKRTIGAHYGQVPQLGSMAQANKIEAYNLPLGSISRMIRCAASKLPGHITTVGFGTMADPKFGGGKINKRTTEDIVEEIELKGQKYLFYKAFPINVAIIRGTTSDASGNITMERESLYVDNLVQAMAARASGGIVIAQVERVATANTLHPRNVRIPGTVVDAVVVSERANHHMSFFTEYSPAYAANIKAPFTLQMPMSERKIIARRALLEVVPNQVVNLGIGLPEGVAICAEEEKVLKYISLTTEPGVHGGVGASGLDFGPGINYDGMLEMNQQFDFYNGGGLDVCFLGMAQVDPKGDVNVTRVGPSLQGPGGFIDIAQSTRRVNLLGTFTTGGLEVDVQDGQLRIVREGPHRKFVQSIPEACFSGAQSVAQKQLVHYITERAVFKLTPEGLELTEIAPGIDLQTQVLGQMEFKPIIKNSPRLMNPRIFRDTRMKLLESLYSLDMKSRLHYNPQTNILYIDLHGVSITGPEQMTEVMGSIEGFFQNNPKLVGKVDVFVNYDGFDCRDELSGDFADHAAALHAKYYGSVRRVSSAGFTRHKLAHALSLALEKEYTFDEAFHLLRSMGLSVSRETCLSLCTLRERGEAPGTVTSEDIRGMIEELWQD